MNAKDFRALALKLPEASEGAHMGHPDFRVGGKIFATIAPGEEQGMVKLPPHLQATLVDAHPEVFAPSSGAWGRQGCTQVVFARAPRGIVRQALAEAWRKTAPKKLLAQWQDELPG